MQDAIITFPIFGQGFYLDFPRYFTIFGTQIFYYGVILGLGLFAGALYAMWRAPRVGLSSDNVLDFLIFAVPMAIIVSRFYYISFDLGTYLQDPLRIITGVRTGGLTIYGVIFGALFGVWLCGRVKKLDYLAFMDIGALGLLIGQAIGRFGNFTNREIFGRATDLPWRMGLTARGETIYVHPTFLYESLWNIAGFFLLQHHLLKRERAYKGQIFVLYLAWYGLGRTWIELLRDPSQNMLIGRVSINLLIAIACFVGALIGNHILVRRHGGKGKK